MGGGGEMNPEVVLMTGCSTGIGRATAMTLATAGYEVVATARRPEELEAIGTAMALPLDVTDEASIEAAVGAVAHSMRRVAAWPS
jgi:NADP-dependent 3-hydroxy acid dehydrogenase YdfG